MPSGTNCVKDTEFREVVGIAQLFTGASSNHLYVVRAKPLYLKELSDLYYRRFKAIACQKSQNESKRTVGKVRVSKKLLPSCFIECKLCGKVLRQRALL